MGSNENASKKAKVRDKEGIGASKILGMAIETDTHLAKVRPVATLGKRRSDTQSATTTGSGTNDGLGLCTGNSVGGCLGLAGGDGDTRWRVRNVNGLHNSN